MTITQSEADKAFAEVMQKRFKACMDIRDKRLKDGKRYRDYYSSRKTIEVEDKDDGGDTSSWVRIGYPLIYQLVEAFIPAILLRDPVCQVSMREGADDVQRQLGMVVEKCEDHWWREGAEEGFEREYELATYDTIFNGMCALEADLDAARLQPRLTHVRCKDLLYDAEADSRIESLRWAAVRKTCDIRTARRMFMKDKKDEELKPNSDEWKSDRVEEAEQHNDPDNESMDSERFSYWRVYIKGDNPHTDKADVKAPQKTEPEEGKGKEKQDEKNQSIYKGKNEMVYIAKQDGEYVVLKREPWPSIFDHDSFPLVFMRLTTDPDCFHPESMLAPVEPLQQQSNWALSYHVSDVRDTAQKKIIYDASKLDQEQIDALENLENRTMIGIKGGLPKDSVWVLDWKPGNSATVSMVGDLSEIFKESTALKELVQEGRSHESATAAALKDKWRDVKISKPAKLMEKFVRIGMRKMLQIAMTTLKAEDIAKIVGEEMLMIEEIPYVDENGQPKTQIVSPVWPDKWTPEQIRSEVLFMIEPNSMRFVSREQIVQEIGAIKQQVQADIGALANMGVQINGQALAKFMFALTKKMATTLDIRNVDDLLPTPEDIIQLPMQPPAIGPSGVGAAPPPGRQPSGELTPQLQARMQQMEQMGAMSG